MSIVNRNYHINLEEEKRWIEEAKQDTRGFEPIYNRYYDEIFRFIYRRTSAEVLSHDLTSECFYKALKNIRKYQFRGHPIGSWLYAIARNEVNRNFKAKKRQFIVEIDEFEQEVQTDEETGAFKIEDLVWVLKQISEDDLMLVELKYFEHKTFKEVALLMNMKESAAKMRLYRLLLSMKKKIEEKNGTK